MFDDLERTDSTEASNARSPDQSLAPSVSKVSTTDNTAVYKEVPFVMEKSV